MCVCVSVHGHMCECKVCVHTGTEVYTYVWMFVLNLNNTQCSGMRCCLLTTHLHASFFAALSWEIKTEP